MKVGSEVKGVPKHLREWIQIDNLHMDEIGTREEGGWWGGQKLYIWCDLGFCVHQQ